MSGGITATTVLAAAAVAGTAYSIYNGERQADAQKKAMAQAKLQGEAQAKKAEQDMNRANMKKPDSSAILDAAQQAGRTGPSGTMITGSGGIDPNTLVLGRNALLGQ